MSFAAYIENIYKKTGKTPEDFRLWAQEKRLLEPEIKVMQIVDALKIDFDLGHGHAMAVVLTLKPHMKLKK